MRALVLSFAALIAMGLPGYAQDQTLRGVYAPPGATPPAAKSGKSSYTAPDYAPVGGYPRVTISGRASRGTLLPNNVNPAPISDRPGYGTAIVNGRRSIVDLSNNRIVQVEE